MNLDELVPAPNSVKVNALAKRVFGHALDLENISESRAEKLQKNLAAQMEVYESNLGAKVHNNSKYTQMKLALEALTKHIAERAVEEDDVEEDNEFNTAAANAAKAGKSHFTFNGKKYPVKMDKKTAQDLTDDVKESVVTEGQVETSELVMAAKSMVDKFDAMIQDIGEMLNEELQPLCDKIRDEMGSDVAESFHAQMETALNSTMANMKAERSAADSATRVLTGETPAEPMGEPAMDDGIGADEMDMEPTTDMDDFEASDAAIGGEDSPVGREKR